MTEPRSPLDQAIDLLVFAPLGLAAMAQEHIPGLIEKGRERWATQATMARMVGEFAVSKGRQDATKAARRASDVLEGFGIHLGERAADAPGADAPTGPTPSASASGATPPPSPPPAGQSTADHLAIPGYDSLSAPQVVSRLDGLSSEELEAVRAYEQSTRGRKTILGRVAQLQALLD